MATLSMVIVETVPMMSHDVSVKCLGDFLVIMPSTGPELVLTCVECLSDVSVVRRCVILDAVVVSVVCYDSFELYCVVPEVWSVVYSVEYGYSIHNSDAS